MEKQTFEWEKIEDRLEEIIGMQETKLLHLGRRIVPLLTKDDMLQPNDFPELENNPEFRYEEGSLEGMRTVEMALRSMKRSLVPNREMD